MKFAREFREALDKQGFPAAWVETAIPYRQLKKLLKKIQQELGSLGLDSATLAQLHHSSPNEEEHGGNGVAYQYDFEGDKTFVPKLTFFINIEDGTPVDAELSPATRRYFEAQALKHHGTSDQDSFGGDGQTDSPSAEEGHVNGEHMSDFLSPRTTVTENTEGLRRVDVQLRFDAEFFGLLQGDVTSLDNLQAQEQKALEQDIQTLSKSISEVAKPKVGFNKSDLNRWRELFDLYLQAGVFFSTNEFDHGSRTSVVAAQKLAWFQNEVMKRNIIDTFKMKGSYPALYKFVQINIMMLKSLKFQEINQLAISKILKKFDKRTNLGAARTFPKLIMSDTIMSGSMAKAVCSHISQELIQIVPQIEDHSCPICCDICWRPIRMKCNHLVCIRCTILLQRQKKRNCPLCRENVVLEANTDSIDRELEGYLRKYFPKEVNEKQIANEIADGLERFGHLYVHRSQSNCAIM